MSPKILHNTNFPKITRCPSKARNYRTQKKKKVLRAFTPPLFPKLKSQDAPLKQKIIARLKKKKGRATLQNLKIIARLKKKVLRLFRIIAHQKKFTQLL